MKPGNNTEKSLNISPKEASRLEEADFATWQCGRPIYDDAISEREYLDVLMWNRAFASLNNKETR